MRRSLWSEAPRNLQDPLTFRTLPWTPRTGWVLCDAYLPDGSPSPLDTRRIRKRR